MRGTSSRRRLAAPLTRLARLALAGAAGLLGFACGLDLAGSKAVVDPPVDAGSEVTPNLPPSGDAGVEDVDAGDARDADCPRDRAGSALVRVPAAAYCIEATEVSNAEYDAFLAATGGGKVDAGVPEGGLPPSCGLLTSFHRVGAVGGGAPQNPVTRIPWCAAYAYCSWAGKRLCGGRSADRDAASGEWYSACSAMGTREHPYGGDAAVSGACNTDEFFAGNVGSHPLCEGGVPGLFDMVGNVAEWIDDCDEAGVCPIVGGFYSTGIDYATCRSSSDVYRESTASSVGFRCCSDVE